MKKILYLLLLPAYSFPATSQKQKEPDTTRKPSAHHLEIGPQTSNIAIKQKGAGGKQVGWITGGRIEYQYRNKWYVDAYLEKSWGHVKDYYVQDFWTEGTFGYDFSVKWFSFIPYAGLGYQFFKENQNNTRVAFSTYHPYIPGGVYVEARINSMFSVGVNTKGLFSLKTLDYIGGFTGSYWQLKARNNLVIEIPMNFQAETKSGVWGFSVVPYYRLIRFGPSISVNSLGVPLGIESQRNVYFGGRILLTYAF